MHGFVHIHGDDDVEIWWQGDLVRRCNIHERTGKVRQIGSLAKPSFGGVDSKVLSRSGK